MSLWLLWLCLCVGMGGGWGWGMGGVADWLRAWLHEPGWFEFARISTCLLNATEINFTITWQPGQPTPKHAGLPGQHGSCNQALSHESFWNSISSWGGVVTKGLEIPSDPVRSSHKRRSRKVLKFPGLWKCIQPYPCALLNTCRLGVEA